MTTQTAQTEIQVGIRHVLTNDSAFMALVSAVLDMAGVVVGQAFPYVTLGDMNEMPYNTMKRRGYSVSVMIHIWSQARTFRECQNILARMNTLLDQQVLPLATQQHVATWYQSAVSQNDPDNITRHMIVKYKINTME